MSSSKPTIKATSANTLTSSNSTSHLRNVCGNFPLRAGFFRCLPLPVNKRQQLYRTAKKNADQLIKQVYNDQWRYVPPEKNGVLLRKDTSNMTSSFRLVRLGTVLRCQEHEANQILLNTNTESLRGFLRKCFAKNFIDAMLLHEVIVPEQAPGATSAVNNNTTPNNQIQRSESTTEIPSTPTGRQSRRRLKSLTSDSTPIVEKLRAMDRLRQQQEEAVAAAAAMASSSCNNNDTTGITSKNPLDDEELSFVDDTSRSDSTGHTGPAVVVEESPRCSNASTTTSKEEVAPQFEEFLTIKWGVFDTSVSGKSDLCVVDYISSAFVPVSEDKELVNLWCLTSVDGASVGCLELKETHSVTRKRLSKLGVFWRKISDDETEITLCGSFPSKHAKFAGKIFLECLGRLQGVIEDLRLSNQLYMQRSNWIDDKDRSSCHLCMRNFHALRRKHHCRKCGEVICHDCSLVENVELPVIGYSKLRLCKVCLVRAKSTPLQKTNHPRSNVFDRTEHVRSLSKTDSSSISNWPSRSTLIHTSIDENNCTESFVGDNNSSLGNRSSCSMVSSGDESPPFNSSCEHFPVVPSGRPTLRAITQAGHNNNNNGEDDNDVEDIFDSRKLTERFSAMEQTKASSTNMFDLLCELACQTLSCPIACVCIQESTGGEAFRSVTGLDDPSLDTEMSLFVDKIMGSSPSIILDSRCDKHVQSLFRSALPSIRFFAGSPIYSRAGKRLGYVCVADTSKRESLGASCAFTMERLATLAVTTLERNGAMTTAVANNSHSSVASANVNANAHHCAPPARTRRNNNLGSPQEYHEVHYDDSNTNRLPVRIANNLPTREDPISADAKRYYEAQERMRKLLLKSYHTQQQLAAGNGAAPMPPTC